MLSISFVRLSQVLGLKECATTAWLGQAYSNHHSKDGSKLRNKLLIQYTERLQRQKSQVSFHGCFQKSLMSCPTFFS